MMIPADNLTDSQKNDIRSLVEAADNEFVPPLSSRGSTTQKDLLPGDTDFAGKYVEEMLEQSFILSIENDRVVGFLSYRKDYTLSDPDLSDITCDYISTIIVDPGKRRQGRTGSMYKKLFETRPGKRYVTRTWSSNLSHISILNKLGFEALLIKKDDRGKGIDTIYFSKGEENEKA